MNRDESSSTTPRFALIIAVLTLIASGCSGSSSGGGGDGDAGGNPDVLGDAGDAGDVSDAVGDVSVDGPAPDANPDAGFDGGVTARLSGAPSDDAIDAIPDVAPPPHPDDAWADVGGFALSRTRLVLVVDDDATVGEINAALDAAVAAIIGGSPVTGIINAEVPDDGTGDAMGAAMLALEDAAGVLTAHPESDTVSTSLASAHNPGTFPRFPSCDADYRRWRWDDQTSAAWGLQVARVPFVWNLRSRLERLGNPPLVAAFERGWDTTHPDLWLHDDTQAGLYAQRCTDHAEGDDRNECLGEVEHGLIVAGVMAAEHDDVGIEGVFPTTFDAPLRVLGLVRSRSAETNRRAVENAIRTRSVRLVNYSAGRYYTRSNPDVRPTTEFGFALWTTTGQALSRSEGLTWDAMVRRLSAQRSDFLVLCSAGNDGVKPDYTFQASDTGGCQYAATTLGNDHLLAVENLADPGEALHASSNRGGNIAAPGTCVGGAGVNGSYVADTGTSFSSPFVAGALAVLWGLDPELSYGQVREALLDGARPGAGGSAARLDLLGSVREIDRIRGDNELVLELLDIDDITVDGRLRMEPEGPARDLPLSLGDGCIDMSDLRALRDAYLLVNGNAGALDGGASHPMRDLNGDGYVAATAGTPITGAADREDRFSRFDLNGDDRIDADDFGWLADHWGQCREDVERVAQTEGYTARDIYRFELEDEAPTVPLADSYDVWFEVPATEELLVRVAGAPARWVSLDQDDALFRDSSGSYWTVVSVPRSCGSALPQACTMSNSSDGEAGPLRCVRIDPPGAGGDIVADPSTAPPIPTGSMLFLSENIVWDGEDPLSASQGLVIYNGLDFQTAIEMNAFELGAHPRVTPTGDLALLPTCLGETIGQFEQCIQVVDLSEPTGEDEEYVTATFDPPGDSATVEVIQLSEGGRTALVQEDSYFDANRNWFLVDLDAATECAPLGAGACDPFGASVTEVVPDVEVLDYPYLALDGTGRVWYPDAEGRIRSQIIGSLIVNDTCVDAPSTLRFEIPGESVQLSRSTGSPIAADGKALVHYHQDGWTLGYVDVDGELHVLGSGYTSEPDDAAAWGPGGRTILYRDPSNRIVFAHIDQFGDHEEYWVLDDSGTLVDARVSWAPGWSYFAAWSPGSALGGDVGDVVVWRLEDGAVATAQNHDDRVGEPAWSPDGQRLAFGRQFTEDSRSDFDIWTVHLPSGSIDFLTNDVQSVVCQGEDDCPYSDQSRPIWGRALGR